MSKLFAIFLLSLIATYCCSAINLLSVVTDDEIDVSKYKVSELEYGQLKNQMMRKISFHNKELFCRVCEVQCLLLVNKRPKVRVSKFQLKVNSSRFLKVAWIRELLARSSKHNEALAYMDVDTLFPYLNCSVFDDLLEVPRKGAAREFPSDAVLVRSRPHVVPKLTSYCWQRYKDEKQLSWSIALATDLSRGTDDRMQLQTGVMVIRNDCRSRTIFEYVWLLRKQLSGDHFLNCAHLKYGGGESRPNLNNSLCFSTVIADLRKLQTKLTKGYLHNFNLNDVLSGFSSDQQAINVLSDILTQQFLNSNSVAYACLQYRSLCHLFRLCLQTDVGSPYVKMLDRRIYNSFPTIQDKIWTSMGHLQGDENNSTIVHFAGEFGGSNVDSGAFDATNSVLIMCEFTKRHIGFLHSLVSQTSGRITAGEILSQLQSVVFELEKCIHNIFSSLDIEMAESISLSCLGRAYEVISIIIP